MNTEKLDRFCDALALALEARQKERQAEEGFSMMGGYGWFHYARPVRVTANGGPTLYASCARKRGTIEISAERTRGRIRVDGDGWWWRDSAREGEWQKLGEG